MLGQTNLTADQTRVRQGLFNNATIKHRMEASLRGQQGRVSALAPNRKRLLGGGLGALMIAAAPAMAIAQDAGDGLQLDEIVVTAQKRAERIQDVPISITALTGADLEKRGLVGMGDYLLAQPSVVIQDRGPARNQIVIRGISTVVGSENPTVAFYIDEVPVSSGLGINANGFPDLRTFDVGRVEVLRGPQGTLYGAGSMGGTVKVVPNRAKIGEWQVKAESSLSSTAGGGLGNEVAAAVNAPLGDTLAVRVAGYHYHEAGFIKDRFPGSPNPSAPVAALGGASWADVGVSSFGMPARSVDDANAANVDGARAGVTFQPTEKLEIFLTALAQRSKANGLPENMPTLGTYTQSRFLPEMLKDNYQLYDALINYDLGFGRLTSVTAYVNRSQVQYRDVSASFLGAPISLDDDNENKNFSQEIRFSSDALNPFGILLGGFYSRTTAHAIQDAAWHGTAQSLPEFTSVLLGSPVAAGSSLFHKNDRNVGEQLSGFGELSYRPIESLKLSAGLRVANYTLTTDAFQDGALNGNVVTSYSAPHRGNGADAQLPGGVQARRGQPLLRPRRQGLPARRAQPAVAKHMRGRPRRHRPYEGAVVGQLRLLVELRGGSQADLGRRQRILERVGLLHRLDGHSDRLPAAQLRVLIRQQRRRRPQPGLGNGLLLAGHQEPDPEHVRVLHRRHPAKRLPALNRDRREEGRPAARYPAMERAGWGAVRFPGGGQVRLRQGRCPLHFRLPQPFPGGLDGGATRRQFHRGRRPYRHGCEQRPAGGDIRHQYFQYQAIAGSGYGAAGPAADIGPAAYGRDHPALRLLKHRNSPSLSRPDTSSEVSGCSPMTYGVPQ
ncbi:TonB-dependent receptor plug domain-containing protein [Nitrospirillum sp. BR 11163]|nr:TonB-dependent receptor plug domain-containing protein [Nitrospirillum sp. BR 11163]MEA1674666.1 TonB-dependent receptor plug domain-containing protein [Nitrospirillum sp. BR 11163]